VSKLPWRYDWGMGRAALFAGPGVKLSTEGYSTLAKTTGGEKKERKRS